MTIACFRHSVLFKSFSLFLVALFLVSTVGVDCAAAVTVPGGTTIITQLDESVSTENRGIGDSVRMSVATDVKIQGKVVVRVGARVDAVISHIKKPGAVGAPGEIEISVKAVEAVNGKMIRVIPQSKRAEGENKQTSSLVVTLLCCVLGLLMKGGHATINAGSTVSTNTAQEFSLEDSEL